MTPAAAADDSSVGDLLYQRLQARALEASVRDLARASALAGEFARFRIDPRGIVVACAMRRPPQGGDVCCPGPLSPGPALAFGATPLEFLRCAARKGTSAASARAGARSWTDLRRGLLACEVPPGGMTQVMAGVAFAFRRRGEARAALVFEDRAALETGRWHEGMSFAAALQVPLIVALTSAPAVRAATLAPAEAAANYGLEAVSLAGESWERVHEQAAAARRRAVRGGGPSLLDLGPPDAGGDGHDLEFAGHGADEAAVRRADRAAGAAVRNAVARLANEPGPRSADALAPVLSDVPVVPHWTRSEPAAPGGRGAARPGEPRPAPAASPSGALTLGPRGRCAPDGR